MTENVVSKVRRAIAQSEFVQAVASVRRDGGRKLALGETPLRPLFRDEIAQLEKQGNSSPDWSRVLVVEGFDWRWLQHRTKQRIGYEPGDAPDDPGDRRAPDHRAQDGEGACYQRYNCLRQQ